MVYVDPTSLGKGVVLPNAGLPDDVAAIQAEMQEARNGHGSLDEFLDSLRDQVGNAAIMSKTLTATAGQGTIDVTDKGTIVSQSHIIAFLVDGSPQYSSYSLTNETTITMNDGFTFSGGEKIHIQWIQGSINMLSSHAVGHEDGGYDPLNVSKLEGFQEEVIDKIDERMKGIGTNLTVTVGTGGDYTTINAALNVLSKYYPLYAKNGFTVELKLLSGFVMAEQVHVKGVDLGFITITSVDAVVFITKTAILEVLVESRKPAFYGSHKAVLPTIGCLFEYTTAGANENYDGVTVAYGSKVQLLPGAGVNKAERGLGAYYGSEAFCYMPGLTEGGGGEGAGTVQGVSFKDCTERAFMATYGSSIKCARAQLQGCTGDYGVYVIWNSNADLYQSDISNCTGTAVCSRDASVVNARETCVSDSARGYHALHNGRINARYHANSWSQDGAKRCSEYAVIASYNSQIDASELPVDNSDIGVHAFGGSTVAFLDAATATGCRIGLYAVGAGSEIDAPNVNASNCTDTGVFAKDGATINANNANANTSTNYGYRAENGSTINAEYSTANTCGTGMFATRASRINARSASATSCVTYGANSFESSTINAAYFNATGAGTNGFYVQRGSNIGASNATGTLSQTANTVTASGTIYQ